MHVKQKLMYMGFGCLLTLAGYILACASNDIVAQSGVQDVTFGEITCRNLRVVDEKGNLGVALWTDEDGGAVYASGKDGGSARLGNKGHGGEIAIWNKAGENVVQAGVTDTGEGVIVTRDKHGYPTDSLPKGVRH